MNQNFEANSHFESHTPQMQGEPKPALRFLGNDTLFAWLSIVFGILLARTLPLVQNTLGAVLIVCLLFAFGGIYLKRAGLHYNVKTVLYAVAVVLLSVGFLTGANQALQRWLFLFILCAFLYWIWTVCNLNGHRIFGEDCFRHAVKALFVVPTTSVIYLFPALMIRDNKNVGRRVMRTVLWILLGLACAIIPTTIIIALLSYDDQFIALLKKVFDISPEVIWEWIKDIHLGFFFAILLFGVLFGTKRRRERLGGKPQEFGEASCHVLPRALLCAAVTPILVIYLIFFISQWNYYISAFTNTLPDGMTYASYARDGFFQLCWVCAINAVMLLLFHLLIKRNGKPRDALRTVYASVISVFTLILIATALSKMILYIDSFGLTQKRVYASWLMVLLAVCFIAVLVRQCIHRFPLCSVIAISCVLFFALITIPNVDGMIASYNVDAYLSGELETVDIDSIEEYGVSAVPALVELRDHLEENASTNEEHLLLHQTNNTLAQIKAELEQEPDHVFTFNIPKIRAKALLSD